MGILLKCISEAAEHAFRNLKFLTTCSYGMYVFYCIFAQFMRFPVLDFGLVHSGSEPFNYPIRSLQIVSEETAKT